MKVFWFFNKHQLRTYVFYCFIALFFSVVIFLNLNVFANEYIAYLLACAISFISVMIALNEVNKGFEKIVINDDMIAFHYLTKGKSSFVITKADVSVRVSDDFIEFKYLPSKKTIGRAYRSRVDKLEEWDDLVSYFQSLK